MLLGPINTSRSMSCSARGLSRSGTNAPRWGSTCPATFSRPPEPSYPQELPPMSTFVSGFALRSQVRSTGRLELFFLREDLPEPGAGAIVV